MQKKSLIVIDTYAFMLWHLPTLIKDDYVVLSHLCIGWSLYITKCESSLDSANTYVVNA